MSHSTSTVPERIGRYDVVGKLGGGSCGVVYKARDPLNQQLVAIKLGLGNSDEEASDASHIRSYFYNEVRTAGNLVHPHIVEVRDVSEVDGWPYLVMEYIEGGSTLRTYCDVNNLLPTDEVGKIIHACALALDYAHRRGVIHRDVKPTNILLTPERQPKIADFGIARRQFSDTTEVSGFLGTPLYMAPEQINDGEIGGATDIYGLGGVMFHLLTGRTPFKADQLSALVHRILNEPARSVLEFRPDLPPELGEVVSRALQKDPSERYGSGREMAADLSKMFFHETPHSEDVAEDQKFELVRAQRFFQNFTDAELWEVIHVGRWLKPEPGEKLVTQGQHDLTFYLILEGSAALSPSSKSATTLGPGACFGEMGYTGYCEQPVSVMAREGVTSLSISAPLMAQASVGCRLKFNDAFIRNLVERLSAAQQQAASPTNENVVVKWRQWAKSNQDGKNRGHTDPTR